MSNGIKASVLSCLLRDQNCWQRPDAFGGPGYTAEARVRNAGTTFEDLEAAGYAIQTDLHGRYNESDKLGRDSYKAQHGGVQVDSRVSKTTSPSGLRPRTIPNASNANDMAGWHTHLAAVVAAAKPDDLIQAPACLVKGATGEQVVPGQVDKDGKPIPATTTRASTPRQNVTGAPLFVAYRRSYDGMVAFMSGCLDALNKGEDQGVLAPLATEFTAWSLAMPEGLKGVTSASFDTTITARKGVEVEILPSSPATKLAAFIAKGSGLAAPPTTYKVERISEDGTMCFLQGEGMNKQFPVKHQDLRRVVRQAPPAPIDPKTWKVGIFEMATWTLEGVEPCQVLVLAHDEQSGLCDIQTETGDEYTEIPATELSAPAV